MEKDKDKEDVTELKHPVPFEKINGDWRVDPQPNSKDSDAPANDKVEK